MVEVPEILHSICQHVGKSLQISYRILSVVASVKIDSRKAQVAQKAWAAYAGEKWPGDLICSARPK
jgi:hypothetical protein